MKYYVGITETLHKTVCVEAEFEEEAIEKVKDAYCESDIVLTSDDYVEDSTNIVLEEDQKGCRTIDDIGDGYYQHID